MALKVSSICFLFFLITCSQTSAQSDSARRAWLAAHTAPIRTLDLNDPDDSDLTPIGRAIGDRRFVLLGEQTHGDGATFRAKARLIRYLHERLGFDLLVFESGFYDCRRTWVDARMGMALADSASGCMFELWWNSAQVRPLLAYLDAHKGTTRSLELAGMDLQPSGLKSRELFADLERFLTAQPDTAGVAHALRALHTSYYAALGAASGSPGAADSASAQLRAALDRLDAISFHDVPALGLLGEAGFWTQTLRGIWPLLTLVRELSRSAPTPGVLNQRDAVMGENLIWLARRYPARKIVVWGATSHLVRDRVGIEHDPAPQMVPAGHVLEQAFPGEVYTIGFLGVTGEFGISRRGTAVPRSSVPQADSASLDGLWRETGQELAFLDLRTIPPGGEWLRTPLIARPLGYAPMRTTWPRHLDAFFFIRQMTPSTPIVTDPPSR